MTQIGEILKRMNFLWIGNLKEKGVNVMRKIVREVLACMVIMGTLCVSAGAVSELVAPPGTLEKDTTMGVFASGSFSMSVSPYGKSEASTAFPLEAGETVSISAVYTPENASMDFGLVDSDGVFHYFNVTNGSVDKTIRVNENGNYTLSHLRRICQ